MMIVGDAYRTAHETWGERPSGALQEPHSNIKLLIDWSSLHTINRTKLCMYEICTSWVYIETRHLNEGSGFTLPCATVVREMIFLFSIFLGHGKNQEVFSSVSVSIFQPAVTQISYYLGLSVLELGYLRKGIVDIVGIRGHMGHFGIWGCYRASTPFEPILFRLPRLFLNVWLIMSYNIFQHSPIYAYRTSIAMVVSECVINYVITYFNSPEVSSTPSI